MVSVSFLQHCFLACTLLLVFSGVSVTSFSVPRASQVTCRSPSVSTRNSQWIQPDFHGRSTTSSPLFGNGLNEDGEKDIVDNFDAEGFGGYLAPYALALVASVLVTAAFFKFVLLDY